MCSKSSSSRDQEPFRIGRVRGHRGASGEITAVIASGKPERWTGLKRVLLETGPEGGRQSYQVEGARAYRDRLVLKLGGVDDAGAAAGLKGRTVWVAGADVPELPEGEYFLERLVGLSVEEAGRALGTVADILESGGTHVLVVATGSGGELLIPLVQAMVKEVDEQHGRIRVELPPGLEDLQGSDRP